MGMAKYDRLLYILNLLRSRRNLNAARLAEECGVTERSIYRDITTLSEANIPIYYDNGYKLASGNFLPPLNFSLEEYDCLKLALDSSPLAKTARHGDVLKRIKGKVDAGLSDVVRQERKTAVQTTHLEIPVSQSLDRSAECYRTLERAITSDLCLSLQYESITSGVTQRVVEPYFIIFRARAFYFVAFCRLRNEFRTFRIDRVIDVTLMDEHFVRKRGINAHDYFEGSWEVYRGDPVEVVVEFRGRAARVVQAGTHNPNEEIDMPGQDRVIYRVTVQGLEEIRRWILGFGSEATVISPPQLRADLQRFGEYLATRYSDQ